MANNNTNKKKIKRFSHRISNDHNTAINIIKCLWSVYLPVARIKLGIGK